MTKEELIAAMLKVAEQLGHTPSRLEVLRYGGVTRRQIRNHFGTYKRLIEACGLEPMGSGRKVEMETLFRDWAGVARALGRIPTLVEYEKQGQYSIQPLRGRFGSWLHVPAGLRRFAEEAGLGTEWADVVQLIEQWNPRQRVTPRCYAGPASPTPPAPKIMVDRPMYGELIGSGPLVCAPTNEQGVLFLFGARAEQLGFKVLRIQTGFPDIEGWSVMGDGRMQRVRIELEFESRNFLRHGHDLNGCDLIVCWENNWPEAPVEVISLREAIGRSEKQNL